MMTDLERAYRALKNKARPYTDLWRYYDGLHPMVYSTRRLEEIFEKKYVNFSENWCAVVINSVIDRAVLEAITITGDEDATAKLKEIMSANVLLLSADSVHKASQVCGEAFIVAGTDIEGNVEAFYNDPRAVAVFYDESNPLKMRYAAKWWYSDDVTYIVLYYPDHFEYYQKSGKKNNASAKGFQAYLPDSPGEAVASDDDWPENEWGVIPVFHFPQDQRKIISSLSDVIGPQNAANKLFSDEMVAAEFGAFPQRWIIGNFDTTTFKNSPDEIWGLPGGDGQGQATSTGAFSAANLQNYGDAREQIAQNIARIKQLPLHYFSAAGGAPSGEALIAMEAPLNKQVGRFIANMAVTWQKLGQFLLALGGTEVALAEVKPEFHGVMTVQPKTAADVRLINVNAGIPLNTVLKREGWTQDEIDAMEQDRIDEQAAQATLATAFLAAAEGNAGQTGAAVGVPAASTGLNGAQAQSVLETLDGVVTGRIPQTVAVELLVKIGLDRATAELMARETQAKADLAAVEAVQ